MEDLKELTECAGCTWDYIDRLRMALASSCKERDEAKSELDELRKTFDMFGGYDGIQNAFSERDELKKQLHEAKSELDAMRNELCYMCGKYREAHNGACDGCRWKEAAQ